MEENTPIINQPIPQEIKKTVSAFPPKKTIILIVSLILITIGLVYLSVSMSQPTSTSVQKEDPKAFMQTSFEITDPVEDALSTQSAIPIYATEITMTTGTNKVNAVQFELQYDPKALTNVDILPSGITEDWAELFKQIDTENGTIYYALGVNLKQPGTKGLGTIAKITFSKAPGFTGESTTIKFLPKSKAVAEGYDKHVLKSSTDIEFVFPQEVTPVPVEE